MQQYKGLIAVGRSIQEYKKRLTLRRIKGGQTRLARRVYKNESPDRLRDRGSSKDAPLRLGADDDWLPT